MRINRYAFVLCCLVLGLLTSLLALRASQEPDAEALREAFLAEDAGMPQFLALLSEPEIVRDRRVQAKLLQALRADDMEIFQGAAAVAMQVPEIDFVAPRVWRRLETVFLGGDAERKRALLELALKRAEYRQDLRIVALVAEALLEAGTSLATTALTLTEEEPAIAANPAVAEALTSVHARKSAVPLPDFEMFRTEIAPILTTPGSDATACVECHKNRTILRLRPAEEVNDEGELVRQYYRSLLRVIDPQMPEQSLVLRKPTRPAPQTQPAPASLNTHTGGARFEEGDATYRKILTWIRQSR